MTFRNKEVVDKDSILGDYWMTERHTDEQFIANSPTGFKWDCAVVGVHDDNKFLLAVRKGRT